MIQNQPDKGASTFDAHNIKDWDGNDLYSPTNRKTAFGSAEDIIKMNRGVSTSDAKDIVNGLLTANYKIVGTPTPHQMPQSPTLRHQDAPSIIDENNRIRSPDGIERYDVMKRLAELTVNFTRIIMSEE